MDTEPRDDTLTDALADEGTAVGMPRWAKVSLLTALAIVLAFALATVTGIGGDHGPARHGGGQRSPVQHGR